MDVFASIYNLDPAPIEAGETHIRVLPDKTWFKNCKSPLIWEYGLKPPRFATYRCTVTPWKLSIWGMSRVGQGWLMAETSHEEGLPQIARMADSQVIGALKWLGEFDLAESILNYQARAFPRRRS